MLFYVSVRTYIRTVLLTCNEEEGGEKAKPSSAYTPTSSIVRKQINRTTSPGSLMPFLQAVNQIRHLAGRVTAGGEIHVIQHYAKVIQDMEANLSSAGRALLRQQTRGDANHVRKPSLATASTCTDEDWESVETVVEVEDEDDWLLLNVQL